MISDYTLASLSFLIEDLSYNPKIKAIARTMGCLLSMDKNDRTQSEFKNILENNTDLLVDELVLKTVEPILEEGKNPNLYDRLKRISLDQPDKLFKLDVVKARKSFGDNYINLITKISDKYSDIQPLQHFANEMSLRELRKPLNDKYKITLEEEVRKWRESHPIEIGEPTKQETLKSSVLMPSKKEAQDWSSFIDSVFAKHPEADPNLMDVIKSLDNIIEAAKILGKDTLLDKNKKFLMDAFGTDNLESLVRVCEMSEEELAKKEIEINKLIKFQTKGIPRKILWQKIFAKD